MARIAIAIGIGVAGALTGGLAAAGFGIFAGTFAGGSILAGAVEGAGIGLSVGGVIGDLAFPAKLKMPDASALQVSSSAPGTPIPFGYGLAKVAGQLIWTPGLKYTATSVGGGSGGGVSEYLFSTSMAMAFCEGPAVVQRIWGDSKLIYDLYPGLSDFPVNEFPAWSATELYNPGNLVSYQNQVYQCIYANTGQVPTPTPPTSGTIYWEIENSAPPWDSTLQYNPGDTVTHEGIIYASILQSTNENPTDGDQYWRPITSYYQVSTIYPGDETQLPDPLIQGAEGVDVTPAYRGLCYVTWEDFPLQNFGNRIPNVRAEIKFLRVNNVL